MKIKFVLSILLILIILVISFVCFFFEEIRLKSQIENNLNISLLQYPIILESKMNGWIEETEIYDVLRFKSKDCETFSKIFKGGMVADFNFKYFKLNTLDKITNIDVYKRRVDLDENSYVDYFFFDNQCILLRNFHDE